MPRRLGLWAGLAAIAIAAAWVLFVGLPRWYGPSATVPAGPPAAPAQAERKITATLYYVTDDGASLTGIQREVPFGEPAPDQARLIVEAQIAAPESPLVSAIPPGTTLRSLYITDKGEAFVDLSAEVRTRHTGGSQDELLTVYTIVNVLTVNLPAIQRVQILVDGKEADTLAGHVDLRHPIQKQLAWIHSDKEQER
jgi:spore germination protein GerM